VDKGEKMMKILCSREDLLYGVQTVQRAVSNKNPLPILSGIHIKTENNKLKFTATDLEIGIECFVPVTVVEEGSVVLPARYFSEIVRRLPDTKIELSTDKQTNLTTIKYGQSEFDIVGSNGDEFPMLPTIESEFNYSISTELFRNMIKQVIFATSSDDNRPIFTGSLLDIEDNNIVLVATDTHRLALRKGQITDGNINNNHVNVVIPGKALNEISKLSSAADEKINITITENQILFQLNDICLISRLIDGQYPNYRQVIPSSFTTNVRMKTRELLESVERASLLAKEGSNIIKLSIENNILVINTNSPDIGRIHEEFNVFCDGEETKIAFNSKYLIDVLKIIDSEEIYLDLTGSLSPGIIKPVGSDNYLYLILPVRTT
jgi:DNA polymerase III subunit beta